jgi:hypothetical protein
MKSTAVEQDLAQFAIEAHGSLERWNRFSTVSAHLIQGGVFWSVKGNRVAQKRRTQMKCIYKAVEVYQPGKLRVVERPVAEPGPGQVRIRVEASEEWEAQASGITTASTDSIPSRMPSQILISPPNVAVDHRFPPYNQEKVQALNQWFEY